MLSKDQVDQITAIATLLTAVATLFTILEMRRQRTSQYRPEIVLDDSAFKVFRSVTAAGRSMFAVTTGDAKPSDQWTLSRGCFLRCQNVGHGVARDVRLAQRVDGRAFAEKLAAHEEVIGGRIWADDRTIEFDGKEASWMAFQGHELRLGSFAAAASASSHDFPVLLPYEQLVGLYVAAALPSQDKHENLDWDIPPLSLKLSYRDLEGRSFSKAIQVHPTLNILHGSAPGDAPPNWQEVGEGFFAIRDE